MEISIRTSEKGDVKVTPGLSKEGNHITISICERTLEIILSGEQGEIIELLKRYNICGNILSPIKKILGN